MSVGIGKQTPQISIQAGVLDDDLAFVPYTNNAGTIYTINAYNLTVGWKEEYLGAQSISTLSGYNKMGVVGFRAYMNFSLRNMSANDAWDIKGLLGLLGTWDSAVRPTDDTPPPRDVPTVYQISTNTSNTNNEVYNLDSSSFEIQRELTVNNQMISLSFSGVKIKNFVPDNVMVTNSPS